MSQWIAEGLRPDEGEDVRLVLKKDGHDRVGVVVRDGRAFLFTWPWPEEVGESMQTSLPLRLEPGDDA